MEASKVINGSKQDPAPNSTQAPSQCAEKSFGPGAAETNHKKLTLAQIEAKITKHWLRYLDEDRLVGETRNLLAANDYVKPGELLPPGLVDGIITRVVKEHDIRFGQFVIKAATENNAYFVLDKTKSTSWRQLTNFTIQVQYMIKRDGSDAIVVDVENCKKRTYHNRIIMNDDWNRVDRFLHALGLSDLSFYGGERDLQVLKDFTSQCTTDRRLGVETIGLVDGVFVVKGKNITKDGRSDDPELISIPSQTNTLLERIAYPVMEKADYLSMAKLFYESIIKVNNEELMGALLGWSFAAPVAPYINGHRKTFYPILTLRGSKGSGKTHTMSLFMRLFGYSIPKPETLRTTPHALLLLMSSSNAIPAFIDECKRTAEQTRAYDNLMRDLHNVYDHTPVSKGRADQSVYVYHLQNPLVIAGESTIEIGALRERTLVGDFEVEGKNEEFYGAVADLKLESFMPRYIQWLLGQPIGQLYDDARTYARGHFADQKLDDRVIDNLAVLKLGLDLFSAYAKHLCITTSDYDVNNILDTQLMWITGEDGKTLTAGDQVLQSMAVFARTHPKLGTGSDAPIWFRDIESGKIAIDFHHAYPEYRKWANDTREAVEVLDEHAMRKLLRESNYAEENAKPMWFANHASRAIVIDMQKAKGRGLDLIGFESYDSQSRELSKEESNTAVSVDGELMEQAAQDDKVPF